MIILNVSFKNIPRILYTCLSIYVLSYQEILSIEHVLILIAERPPMVLFVLSAQSYVMCYFEKREKVIFHPFKREI